MSTNWTLYEQKMAELQRARVESRPLRGQLEELIRFVHECENRWPIHGCQRLEIIRAIDPCPWQAISALDMPGDAAT